jgi:hypothetical protein
MLNNEEPKRSAHKGVVPLFLSFVFPIFQHSIIPALQVYLAVALTGPPGTLLTACNAGSVDMEWVTEDLTKGEVVSCLQKLVPRAQKIPPQAFWEGPAGRRLPGKAVSVPGGSAVADVCNVKVY